MKKQTFRLFGIALLGGAVLAACQDYSPEDDLIKQKATSFNYEKAFNAEFPVIDPEQNWGFNPMPICGEGLDITRGMNTNSNEWESVYHYEVPGGLTDPKNPVWGWAAGDISNYERAYVYWWFSTHQWPQTLEVRWSEFFVENVWGQPEHSNETGDPAGSHYGGALGRWGMDNMHILDIDKIPAYSPYDHPIKNEADALMHGVDQVSGDYEHVNDFNSAGGMLEQVMYAFDVSSEDWFYKESSGGTLPDHNNWTIQYINGNYYLAFDYWHQKKNDQGYQADNYGLVKPDGYYNDWIIKLSSGKHIVDSYTRRIMCEDLGNTYDWDFNDLVFDVTVYNGEYGNGQSGYYAQITLQAAGGTLPIYIGQKDQAHEAHFLFGVDSTVPVNVDAAGGVNRPAVVFHLPLDDSYEITSQTININGKDRLVLSFDPNQIPIYVTRADMDDPATADNYVLTAVKGQAPQKFACPCDTYWMKEFKNIEGIENKQPAGHPNFAAWIAGTITNEDDAFITERSKTSGDFTVLYADANGSPNSVSFSEDGNVGTIQPWKDLWNNTFDDPLNSQYTEVRSYPNHVNPDGSYMTDNNGFTTYSTTCQAQAPYIYETVDQDDDPTAYSAEKMKAILEGNYANQEAVWGPYAKTVTLDVEQNDKGYVLGTGYYHAGADVVIQAVPRKYMEFEKWEDVDATGAPHEKEVSRDAIITIENIQANKHYKAFFKDKGPSRVNVVIEPESNYGYLVDDHNHTFNGGDVPPGLHSFFAVANEGYIFDYWNDDPYDDWNEIEVDVDGEDVTITAHFKVADRYTVITQVDDASHGSVSGGGTYYEGAVVRLVATPNTGYRFVEWTDEEGNWVFNNATFVLYPEQYSYLANDNNEIKFVAHFESLTSYYTHNLATIEATTEAPLNSGYDLLANVEGLSSYGRCCLEITYTANPSFTYDNNNTVYLDWAGQPTTAFVEIPSCSNQLKINSGGENVSSIKIWVKPSN